MQRFSTIFRHTLGVLLVLSSVAVILFCVTFLLGAEQELYVHLSTATVRFEAESGENSFIAAVLPPAKGQSLPLLNLNPEGESRLREPSGGYGGMLDWCPNKRQFLGFAYGSGQNVTQSSRVFVVPIWSVLLIAAIPPLMFAWYCCSWRQKLASRRCIVCNYDLRASPGTCPECGTEMQSPPGVTVRSVARRYFTGRRSD